MLFSLRKGGVAYVLVRLKEGMFYVSVSLRKGGVASVSVAFFACMFQGTTFYDTFYTETAQNSIIFMLS